MDRQAEHEREQFARLFPAAKEPQRLRPQRPQIGVVDARAWHRISLVAALAGIAVIAEILLLSGPPSIVGFGWQLPMAALIAIIGGVGGYAWSAHQIRPRAAQQSTTWERWAAERGFVPMRQLRHRRGGSPRATARRAVGSAKLHLEPSRSFTQLYRGRLHGDVHIVIGNAYVHGPWGSTTNRRLGHVAAILELPTEVTTRYPASMLDRFLRGTLRRSRRSDLALRELRLESIGLDDACDIRVAAGSDDLDWYELLDPVMVDGLVRDWPVSWQQHGTTLVLYSPAPIGTLDAAQLDAVCQAASAIAQRFAQEAEAPHARDANIEAARAHRGRAHRRRTLLRRLVVGSVVAALLAVPIVVVTQLDARADRQQRERIDERARQFELEYAALRDAELTSYAVHRTAVAVDLCMVRAEPDSRAGRCATLSAADRRELLATEVLTEELIDAVSITVEGPRAHLAATSEQGTTFELRFTAANLTDAERTCAPRGVQCRGGTWGFGDG